MLLSVISVCAKAQDFLPTELFQIFKFWQMDVKDYDRNTWDYIQTVDKQWQLRMIPQKTDHSFQLFLGYYKDKVWYKDEEYGLMLDYDAKEKVPKSVTYQFTDYDSWKRYNRQMALMDAKSLQTINQNGGTTHTFQINDLVVHLSEFPPGINGVDRVYQVMIVRMPQ